MTSKQARGLKVGDTLTWTADGTLGTVTEVQIEGTAVYWFKVEWADGQVCQYTTGRISDLEYIVTASRP